MKSLITLVMLMSIVSGCAREQEQGPSNEQGETALSLVDRTLSAGLDKVKYPKCAAVFDNAKITSCGRATFKVAMAECRQRARGFIPGGALLDETAGDSWIARAGSTAVASDEKRIAFQESQGLRPSYLEFLAVAKGDGTQEIESFNCGLDGSFHLTNVSAFTSAD